MPQTIAIEKIKTDGGTQARAALNEDVVAEYAEAIIAGANMPPVTVFHDGKAYWLADGFHRFHAHRKARAIEIEADVIAGTKRDAKWFSLGANQAHGLRRSNEDKRSAVRDALQDKEWSKLSDRELAAHIGVSHPFVAAIRNPEKAVKQEANRQASESGKREIVNPSVQVESFTTDARQAAPLSQSHEVKDAAVAAIPAANDAAPDGYDGPDLAELVDELQAENTRLIALIQAAEADDLKAEAIKWRRAYEHAAREQGVAMNNAAKCQDREKWIVKLLRRCAKAVGIADPNHTDPRDIAKAVEAFAARIPA